MHTLDRRFARVLVLLVAAAAAVSISAAAATAAGPPFPNPVDNRAVYDEAGVLRAETIAKVEAMIDEIESRTGAEVVVYTQLVP